MPALGAVQSQYENEQYSRIDLAVSRYVQPSLCVPVDQRQAAR